MFCGVISLMTHEPANHAYFKGRFKKWAVLWCPLFLLQVPINRKTQDCMGCSGGAHIPCSSPQGEADLGQVVFPALDQKGSIAFFAAATLHSRFCKTWQQPICLIGHYSLALKLGRCESNVDAVALKGAIEHS